MNVKYLDIAAVTFFVLTLVGVIFVDKSIAIYFHQNYSDVNLVHFSEHLSKLTSTKHIVFLGLFLCALAIFNVKGRLGKTNHILSATAVVYAISVILAFVIKITLARYRPELLFEHGNYGFHFFSFKHSITSMPSGHTVTAYALLFLPGLLLWKRTKAISLILMFCGVFLAFSRILTTDHYFSDVMLSCALVSFVAARYFHVSSA